MTLSFLSSLPSLSHSPTAHLEHGPCWHLPDITFLSWCRRGWSGEHPLPAPPACRGGHLEPEARVPRGLPRPLSCCFAGLSGSAQAIHYLLQGRENSWVSDTTAGEEPLSFFSSYKVSPLHPRGSQPGSYAGVVTVGQGAESSQPKGRPADFSKSCRPS